MTSNGVEASQADTRVARRHWAFAPRGEVQLGHDATGLSLQGEKSSLGWTALDVAVDRRPHRERPWRRFWRSLRGRPRDELRAATDEPSGLAPSIHSLTGSSDCNWTLTPCVCARAARTPPLVAPVEAHGVPWGGIEPTDRSLKSTHRPTPGNPNHSRPVSTCDRRSTNFRAMPADVVDGPFRPCGRRPMACGPGDGCRGGATHQALLFGRPLRGGSLVHP